MLKAKHKTGLVFFPAFDWAISPTHPEREERLLYTRDQIVEEGLLDIDGIVELKAGVIDPIDVQRVHFCVPDIGSIMTESHFISAGGAKTVGCAVMEKKIEKGFALVRPPGHHSMRVAHGGRGFCNVNNEAIMIEQLRAAYGIDRVAIVDTDCHHGDGTQDIYWHDPDTLCISIHQDGRTLYPGSGFVDEFGGPTAAGATLNIPLPPYTSEEGFLYVVNNVVLPVLEEFKPDLIVNSAGQDNHFTDPLTNMNFSAQGYADLTRLLNPDIAVLEGGYSIEGALPYVNLGLILAMAGIDYSNVKEPDYDFERLRQSAEVTGAIKKICGEVMDVWNNRHAIRKQMCSNQDTAERRRNVFYDTAGINEFQHETLNICSKCGGVLKIDSSADTGSHILAIHIPKKACDKCKKTGRQWYETADTGRYEMIMMQDRPEDRFLVRTAS
ncbi:MAG: histone deacetylase [Deltaproteobacteria bacterium]|nr:histone deacetylase [Deltaproteobacteria bacterium]